MWPRTADWIQASVHWLRCSPGLKHRRKALGERRSATQAGVPDSRRLGLHTCLVWGFFGRLREWLDEPVRRQYVPAVVTLVAVAAFWLVGLFGGLTVLRAPHSAVVTLGWLYLMLFLVAGSGAACFFAVTDIVRRVRSRRRSLL
ncbi:MAG: hypothetical protein JWO93_821 [Micrococcaceae bacterium]|nr:hypothetical protein [Micrococcaceae bacterium]